MNALDRFVHGIFQDAEAEARSETEVLAEIEALQNPSPAFGETAGDKIGNYTLVELLGSGGFGMVWRAEQAKPVRREVALKIIKLGMDTREVIARFEAERQALAVLDHPGIAKVFDAGATPTGRPYFVMELVRGASMVRHCDEHALPLAERLALFMEVCHAVQHAHQKGIIHRDLKPSNLLVSLMDGRPVPKVIDFGIAKATGEAQLTDHTLVTRMDRMLGTPAYMSPEQAEPGNDIDTRADIYSLGAVLYELLTGQVPFPAAPGGRTLPRTQDAERPSTRIRSFTAEQLQKLGEKHCVDGPKLLGLVRGDLDWIVMKALEHDRERRYESANALADDVRCYLEHQPVAARPPTAWYVLRRFTQRNKLAVGAAAAFVLLLIAGITALGSMYFREKRTLAKSQQVSQFLKDILAQARVSAALGRDTTMMRDILDKTAGRIGTELQGQPEVEAELRGVIGKTFENIGEYDLATQQTAEAVRLLRSLRSGDDNDLADALLVHASATEYSGMMKEAEALTREALTMRQRLSGENDPRAASAEALLAWILAKTRRDAEAEPFARRAMEQWRKHPEDPSLTTAPKALSTLLWHTNRHDECIAVHEEEFTQLKKQYGPEHPEVMNCLENYGRELIRVKRYDEAEAMLKEVLRLGEKFYKDRNPLADHAYAGLSHIAGARKQYDLQLQLARDCMAAGHRAYDEGHRYYRESSGELAKVLIAHTERQVEEGWRLRDTDAAKAREAAEKALGFLQELREGKHFAPDVKSAGGWIGCLEGRAMMVAATTREAGRALLMKGTAMLRKKEKPSDDDVKKLKKAEEWVAQAAE
jgi:tetratricopeptide (TPR) repeat protein